MGGALCASFTSLRVDAEPCGGGAEKEKRCIPFACHPPRNARRRKDSVYWLLQAAAEGCTSCVMYYVLQQKIPPCSPSENMKYTSLDWAEWSAQRGVPGALEVATFLREHMGREQGQSLRSRVGSWEVVDSETPDASCTEGQPPGVGCVAPTV